MREVFIADFAALSVYLLMPLASKVLINNAQSNPVWIKQDPVDLAKCQWQGFIAPVNL